MGRLVLIRHGESEGNRDRTFTPTPDVPLTDVGRAQVRMAADWLAARFRPVRIVTSPFLRARETAAILAERLGLPVGIEQDLRERSYGALAGRPYTAVRECTDYDPTVYWKWCPPGGGETLLEVAARAGRALDRVAAAAADEEVLVVTHGAVMRALCWHVSGVWGTGRVARNAGVVVVDHRNGGYLGARPVDDD